MREYNITTGPVAFLDILELRQEEEINQHGRMIISQEFQTAFPAGLNNRS